MNGRELAAFRRLLKRAQGGRTQADFAKNGGMSAATLSRFLSSDDIPAPNISTLRRIAGAAENGVTLRELLHACGYGGGTVQEIIKDAVGAELGKRKELSINERVDAGIEDIRQGLSGLTEDRPYFTRDLAEYLDTVNMLYAVEDVSYEVEQTGILAEPDARFPEAEEYAVVNISFSDTEFSTFSAFAVFYTKTSMGKMYVYGAASDYNTLSGFGSGIAQEVEEMSYGNPEVDLGVMDPIRVWADKREKGFEKKDGENFYRRVKEISEGKGISFKEAMVEALFGPSDRPQRILSVEGTGFYTDDIRKSRVKDFLTAHRDTFCRSEAEEDIMQALEAGADITGLFKGYSGDFGDTMEDGWGTAVSNVIFRETDIRVEYWYDRNKGDEEKYRNRPCLMFAQGEVWWFNETEKALTRKSLRIILDSYARELGAEVEGCHFLMEIDEDL